LVFTVLSVEKVLGDGIVQWSNPSTDSIRFEGYRLDQKRVPIFLLTLGGLPITDRFEAVAGGLRRTLTGEPTALGKLTIDHPEGVSITEVPESDPKQKTFVYLWK